MEDRFLETNVRQHNHQLKGHTMQRIFALLALVLGLTACQTTTSGGAVAQSASSDRRYVGAFLPVQSPRVDTIVNRQRANSYFMPLWAEYQAGRVEGARVNITLFLSTGGQETVIYQGPIDGFRYVAVNRSQVGPGTSLCVRAPFEFIAHQQVSAGPGTMCTVPGDVDRYFAEGRGRVDRDAFGVVAIAPAGS
jgi:hypothetical protein